MLALACGLRWSLATCHGRSGSAGAVFCTVYARARAALVTGCAGLIRSGAGMQWVRLALWY